MRITGPGADVPPGLLPCFRLSRLIESLIPSIDPKALRGSVNWNYSEMSAAVLSLLALVNWRFEITAEDIVAACVLVILMGAIWWRWPK
jgi:hypothetical protein